MHRASRKESTLSMLNWRTQFPGDDVGMTGRPSARRAECAAASSFVLYAGDFTQNTRPPR
jgi:hypothetical protein